MAKAYVITTGCYSDYHICAVSLDLHKAEALKKFYEKTEWDEVYIEEYEIDVHYDRLMSGYELRLVQFDSDGSIHHIGDARSPEDENIYETWNGRLLNVLVWAKDKESAAKIAAEKRAMYLAEKEGIS